EDGIRDDLVTGVQTCALPIFGVMLTPSVNVVQSAFPENLQGEISGLSRSVSNLGSSLGTAISGTILVAGLTTHAYGAAMIVLAEIGRAAGRERGSRRGRDGTH